MAPVFELVWLVQWVCWVVMGRSHSDGEVNTMQGEFLVNPSTTMWALGTWEQLGQ